MNNFYERVVCCNKFETIKCYNKISEYFWLILKKYLIFGGNEEMFKFGVKKFVLVGLLLVTSLVLISCSGTKPVDDGIEVGCYYEIISAATEYCLDNAVGAFEPPTPKESLWIYKIDHNNTQRWMIGKSSDGSYKIVSEVNGEVLEASTTGELISRNSDSNKDAQKWKFEKVDEGFYTIRSIFTGKYASLKDDKTDMRTLVVQYDWQNKKTQKWKLVKCK